MRAHFPILAMMLALSAPLEAQTTKAKLVPGSEESCMAKLTNGTPYEVHRRILSAELKGQPVYVDVRANYMPGSGEFLFLTTTFSKHGYDSMLKGRERLSCPFSLTPVVLVEAGEWAEFHATNGRLTVFHSTLRFPEISEAWEYVGKHHFEYEVGTASSKCCQEILLYKELGQDFFRPERLRYDARGYFYPSLGSVKRSSELWRIEIKGADEPNRAEVILDREFRLVSVSRTTQPN